MPDYRIYGPDGKGGVREVPVEEAAGFLGVSEFDANVLIKGMNIVKTICMIAGDLEEPKLIWNQNMPASLVDFVTAHVTEQLLSNPAWSVQDFDWGLIYEDENTLKYLD